MGQIGGLLMRTNRALLILGLFLCSAVRVFGQAGQATSIRTRASAPSTCVKASGLYGDTSNTKGVLGFCTATNVFGFIVASTNVGAAS
jgi:hypothetical protein